ncbi:hypothetical protein AMATHDRAFT_185704 [Amanita thiersii Skay4041]|uniref:Mg-dependent DNase n=1 Tax=Amanita thiersii Skay4041 TaxID=703135 RepID=A0A2A9NX71_9AGAR|nr:hypothetical protein AMATHDRAFT_185704 [Amanita thiersii Skay4041]
MFHGIYHGKNKHPDDFEAMMQRAATAGVKSMIITSGSLGESKSALKLAGDYKLYTTVGCHPTRSNEFDKFSGGSAIYLQALENLIQSDLKNNRRVVAVGECGLDYDRTHFATPDLQKKCFRAQLYLAKKYHLPLFLHSRAAHADFVQILREEGFGKDGGRDVGGTGGVVHSFTGTVEEVAELMDMGFHIGINGCSLKTEANLLVAKTVRLDRIMFETDAPWCTMTSTHASTQHLGSMPPSLRTLYNPPAVKPERFLDGKSVKGRNESASIGCVAWVLHRLHELPLQEIASRAWENTVNVFKLKDIQ